MAVPEVHHLFHEQIADHSFSADRQTLAVARDNNVELYNRAGSKFVLQDELKGHDKLVTGVDIAPNTGRIVTCSQGGSASKGCSGRPAIRTGLAHCLQIEMHMSGNLLLLAGNLLLSCSGSIVRLHMYVGHLLRRNSQWALERE